MPVPRPGGSAFAGGLVHRGSDPGPDGKVRRAGEPGRVTARLGDERAGDCGSDTGNGDQEVDLMLPGAHPFPDLGVQVGQSLLGVLQAGQQLADDERVVVIEVPVEGLDQVRDRAAQLGLGQVSHHHRVAFPGHERPEHRPRRGPRGVRGDRGDPDKIKNRAIDQLAAIGCTVTLTPDPSQARTPSESSRQEHLSRLRHATPVKSPGEEGRRDRVLMLLAIQTGLRVSELTGLNCNDIALGTGASVRCGRAGSSGTNPAEGDRFRGGPVEGAGQRGRVRMRAEPVHQQLQVAPPGVRADTDAVTGDLADHALQHDEVLDGHTRTHVALGLGAFDQRLHEGDEALQGGVLLLVPP
jgi:hypothetical protein